MHECDMKQNTKIDIISTTAHSLHLFYIFLFLMQTYLKKKITIKTTIQLY